MDLIRIRRALISVSDKSGIEEIAGKLNDLGCEIISTGGTRRILQQNGIDTRDITDFTGNPEAFKGRMKTLSFKVESALLFDRDKDKEEAAQLEIPAIDMVICNLYPFEEIRNRRGDLDSLIENIDIGGPTMIRAGAKNYRFVAVVTDPGDYRDIVKELEQQRGSLKADTRFRLMCKAFDLTSRYDTFITDTMIELAGRKRKSLNFEQGSKLRYGENSHQEGYLFRQQGVSKSLHDIKLLHGKELSYNNLSDIQSALETVAEFTDPACAVVKHNNPCGLASGKDLSRTIEFAWAGDPISAFGSILAFNKPVDLATAEFLKLNAENKNLRKFIEVIIAPGFEPEALDYLKFHKNLRIIEADPDLALKKYDLRYLSGALLWQDVDNQLYQELKNVTEAGIDREKNKALIEFGLKAVKNLKSNAIALVRETGEGYCQLIGMGAGQPNRLVSTRLAIMKAEENLKTHFAADHEDFKESAFREYCQKELSEVILVSDAFFPFPDNVEMAAEAGIGKIIQPGGSIRDRKVIKRCNELGIAMLFTHRRHFKH